MVLTEHISITQEPMHLLPNLFSLIANHEYLRTAEGILNPLCNLRETSPQTHLVNQLRQMQKLKQMNKLVTIFGCLLAIATKNVKETRIYSHSKQAAHSVHENTD